MLNSSITFNPFSVSTPESLKPEDVVTLFVPHPEFQELQTSGHQFLHGHRGSGKSMMLRMMTPECQSRLLNLPVSEIPYYSVYFSIKMTELNTQELIRLETELGGFVFSEHVLCTKVLSSIFKSLISTFEDFDDGFEKLHSFYETYFQKSLYYAGWDGSLNFNEKNSADILNEFVSIFDEIQALSNAYIKKRSFLGGNRSYEGPLFGFLDVVLPIIKGLKITGIVSSKNFYLLLDDADNLSVQQTKVLNTWVSYRTTDVVSLKISTQMGYKTQKTTSEMLIESPHDYSEIFFTSVQTGSLKDNYPKLVSDIVKKRLEVAGIRGIDAQDFFPEDSVQKSKIAAIAQEIKDSWSDNGSGFRPGDDVYRYARPEYIRTLSNAYSYKYAGFDQLVHISSGIIRYFLEPAAKMYAEQMKKNNGNSLLSIDPEIQDKIIRQEADEIFISEFNRLRDDSSVHELSGWTSKAFEDLHNLIEGVGNTFQLYLFDKTKKQRRCFSFIISDDPPKELRQIIALGIKHGYFYESYVGKKSGMGRTSLYVLTRRIAPIFKLDPIGFSNYLSFQSQFLLELIANPSQYVNRIRSGKAILESSEPDTQLSLFSFEG